MPFQKSREMIYSFEYVKSFKDPSKDVEPEEVQGRQKDREIK